MFLEKLQSDSDVIFIFLSHKPRKHTRRSTFYMHISIVSVFVTPNQPGMNWSSWMLMEGQKLCGCSCIYCCLLWTAQQGSVTRTRQWLNQKGDTALSFLGSTLLENTVRNIRFENTLDSVSYPGLEALETDGWICKQVADGKRKMWTDWQNDGEMEEEQQRSECRTCSFVFYNAQLWLSDLRTSACCSDMPTLSEKYLFCLKK